MTLTEWEHTWATTPGETKKAVWRAHRIDEIIAGNTPKPLGNDPTLVYHLFPSTAFNQETDLPLVVQPQLSTFGEFSAPRSRVNIDGILVVHRDARAYVQLYRDGIVEYASTDLISIFESNEVQWDPLREFIRNFPYGLRERVLRQRPADDWTYGLTLLHMNGKAFPNTPANAGFDRDIVMLPLVTGALEMVAATLRNLLKEANGMY
jgi:hypothetical protein